MTDYTPNVPLQMADVQWSVHTSVSVVVTGAPGIPAPCGHLLQPRALVMTYTRGSLPDMSEVDWTPVGWDMLADHPDEGGLGSTELTLPHSAFGEAGTRSVPEGLAGMAQMLGIELPKTELLGPVPEWIETAIKSYQPFQPLKGAPVRTDATYHG